MMHKLAHVHISAIRANAHNAHIPLRYVHLCSTQCRPCAFDPERDDSPAHEQTPARRVGIAHAFRVAIRETTNEFVIRNSAKESNSDGHLRAPSNDSLTAAGSYSVPLAAWNARGAAL
jgi:hypothetical protein